MKNRPILLAIGTAVAIFLTFAGNRSETQVAGAAVTAPGVMAAGSAAGFEGLRRAGIIREVTAYNVGVREQTSESPCVGASGKDLCRLVGEGRNVCAANFVALGTVIRIAEFGECVVLDRMHRRFSHRVDIAMHEDAVEEAREFGVQRRHVEVVTD